MNELRFDDRVAIVTGAGGGLGRAYALLLASRGAKVLVNDLGSGVSGEGRDGAPAARVVAEIVAAGGTAVANFDSVATPEGGAAIVESALREFGRLDILINNAGILIDKSIHKMTADMFRPVLAVHLEGTFNVTQPAYVHMRDAGYGRIVSTTSGAGLYGNFGQANYSAAKLGIVGLTKTIALEGAKAGVLANIIGPGALTRMTEGLPGADQGPDLSPGLVAPVVGWLCHESCNMSGETFCAFGGRISYAFIGETTGIYEPQPTIETVAERLGEIMDQSGYTIPKTIYEGTNLLIEMQRGHTATRS